MSEKIIKFGVKGRRTFQFDDNDPTFVVDVIETYNEFSDLDRGFRNEVGEFDQTRGSDFAKAKWGFVLSTMKRLMVEQGTDEKAADKACAKCSMADATHFLKLIQDEANDLVPFFRLKSVEKPSSQESSPTVSYSE